MEVVTDTHNDKLHARDEWDMPGDSRTHLSRVKSARVMVWATVASEGSKSPSVFFEKSGKVNTQVYIKMLTEIC